MMIEAGTSLEPKIKSKSFVTTSGTDVSIGEERPKDPRDSDGEFWMFRCEDHTRDFHGRSWAKNR